MNYHELMNKLKEIFPFENYIKEYSAGDPYKTVFSIATQYLPNKSNVLEFGSGPCDKTAIVASGNSPVASSANLSTPGPTTANLPSTWQLGQLLGTGLLSPHWWHINLFEKRCSTIRASQLLHPTWFPHDRQRVIGA